MPRTPVGGPARLAVAPCPPGWGRILARVLAEEPRCRICGAPSVAVDHIIPWSQGGTDARANLRGLCRADHARKTAHEGNAARRARG